MQNFNFKGFLIANQDKKHQLDIVSTMPQYPTGYVLSVNLHRPTSVVAHSTNNRPPIKYHPTNIFCREHLLNMHPEPLEAKLTLLGEIPKIRTITH